MLNFHSRFFGLGLSTRIFVKGGQSIYDIYEILFIGYSIEVEMTQNLPLETENTFEPKLSQKSCKPNAATPILHILRLGQTSATSINHIHYNPSHHKAIPF